MGITRFSKDQPLRIKARCNESGIVKVLTFLNPDGSAHSITAYDFRLPLKLSPKSTDNIWEMSIGDGLAVIGAGTNKLQITLSEIRGTQRPDSYFWQLFSAYENLTWLAADWEFYEGTPEVVEEVDTIVINPYGEDINITIENGVDLDIVNPYRGAHDATTLAFPSTGGRYTGGVPAVSDYWQTVGDGIIAGVFVPQGSHLWARQNAPTADWDVLTGWKII